MTSANLEGIGPRLRDFNMTRNIAEAEEHNRSAREIHDTLVQSFAGIVLNTETLGAYLEIINPRGRRALSRIKALAQSGLEEARCALRGFRPKALDGNSLPEALEYAAKYISQDGQLSCSFSIRGKALQLPTEVEDELFRIFQEAITNVRKHAVSRAAWITLEFKARQIVLSVRDDGIGFAAATFRVPKQGRGLVTMREGAARIGGRLEMGMPRTGGCEVRVVLPVSKTRERFFIPRETTKR